jgi:hypothetical protein
LDQFGSKFGLLTGFSGGEWFAIDAQGNIKTAQLKFWMQATV